MKLRGLALEIEDQRTETGAAGRSGGLAAFDEIMRAHQKLVLSTALRLLGNLEDAQDAAQEVFLKLYRNLDRLEDARQIGSWLYRVTVNACHDEGRRRRRWPVEDAGDTELAAEAPGPEAQWQGRERKRIVLRGLATLPEKERAALVLRDAEGLTTREVAEILGSSETTVRSQICSARIKLKNFTERYLRKRV